MRSLSQEEIQALLTKPKKTGPSKTSVASANPVALGPVCNHTFQADRIIVSGTGREFPTKRCSTCQVWLLLQPDEIQVEVITDMGSWLG
jgi:hypothetical protein